MANGNSSNVVSVLVDAEKKETLEQVTVSVVKDKEIAAILHASTDKLITLAFGLQDVYENPSQYRKDALQESAVMFLKSRCQNAITAWANLVTKMEQVQQYSTMTRIQVAAALAIHPKYKSIYDNMNKAVAIKRSLQ